MKKIFSTIILILSFFSIFNFVNAEQGLIEKALDLQFGPEKYEMKIRDFGNYSFYDVKTANDFNNVKSAVKILKQEFAKKYEAGIISKDKMNGLVKNLDLFVYHSDRYYYYLNIKEKNNSAYSYEADDAILRNLKSARIFFNNIKYIRSLVEKKK